jgi:hypothetical protein
MSTTEVTQRTMPGEGEEPPTQPERSPGRASAKETEPARASSSLDPEQLRGAESVEALIETASAGADASGAKPQPNIVFVRKVPNPKAGLEGEPEFITPEAPTRIRNGQVVYEMPGTEEQRRGFFHENAAEIIRAFPEAYKPLRGKGE